MIAHQYKIRKQKELEEKESLEFDPKEIILKNSEIRQIHKPVAEKIILEYEWLKTLPDYCKYFFGIFFKMENKEYLGGVVIYSTEYSANKMTTWSKYGFYDKIILLSRGVCLWWTPKNTSSYFISKTIDWIKKNTDYKIITATVDPSAGEIGTIYQSLNWYYIGLMRGNYNKSGTEQKRFSVLINGKLRYSRSIRKELGSMKKEVILEKYPNAVFIDQYRKRRYFYFIGNKRENALLHKQIEHLILPYPKRDNDISGNIYLITNLINDKKYVGQTTRGFNQRYDEYKKQSSSCNPYVIKAFNKYGFENFKFEIIDIAKTLTELNEKEIYYISFYQSNKRIYGYNIEEGGKNATATLETRQKLSEARKNIKQSQEWIDKRIEAVAKPVIKVDSKSYEILEAFISLAEAGRKNNDNLSYQQIQRKCSSPPDENEEFIWCFEEDYKKEWRSIIKNNIKAFDQFSESELDEIYNKHENGVSIRELSISYEINFSTLNLYIQKRDNDYYEKYNDNLIAVCKKTGKIFDDYKNVSGTLTTHIKKTYPELELPSKFKRKSIEIKTGKFWYEEYFNFIDKNETNLKIN